MTRAAIPALLVMLVAACTPAAPAPEPEPEISRFFVGGGPVERNTTKAVSDALGSHGIHCSSFDGSIWGSGRDSSESWRTTCSGTASQWSRAEPDIARLEQEGILDEPSDKSSE